MSLRNDRELAITKRKLQLLEESYDEARSEKDGDERRREIELQSLKRLINQLKAEIARYEAHQVAR